METRIEYQYRPQVKAHRYILPSNPKLKYQQYDEKMYDILKQTERCPFPTIRQLIILYRSDETKRTNKQDNQSSKIQNGLLLGTLLNNNMGNSTLKRTNKPNKIQAANQEQKLEYIDINHNLADILKQSYHANPNKQEIDDNYVQLIEQSETSELKIQKLLSCTNRYNQLYNTVRQSLKQNYPEKMREIERYDMENERNARQLENKVKNSMLKENSSQMSSNDFQQKKLAQQKQIQTEIARRKLKLFEENQKKYQQSNQNFLKIQNSYFNYVAFCQEFQRALIIASASQTPQYKINKSTASMDSNSIDNTLLLEGQLKQLSSFLKNFTKIATVSLFEYRENCKNPNQGGISGQLSHVNLQTSSDIKDQYIEFPQLKKKWIEIQTKLSSLYSRLSSLSSRLSHDRENNRHIFEEMTELYPNFLRSYTRAQEVYRISSKNTIYQELIREEKNKLQIHLKKNFGMIVPYTWTDQYAKSIVPLQSAEKKYLRELFVEELEPLEVSVLYINREYEKLYKQSCEGDPGVRRKVEKYLKDFQKFLQINTDKDGHSDNNFVLHLMQSCRKLLRLTK